MDPIYVTGHRNPDTDSIVAAMAYAALRNAVGDREYEAACLGQVSRRDPDWCWTASASSPPSCITQYVHPGAGPGL